VDKSKTTPIPVRLDDVDVELIARLQAATGINRSEIIRRAVHYALVRAQETGSLNHLFGDESAIRDALGLPAHAEDPMAPLIEEFRKLQASPESTGSYDTINPLEPIPLAAEEGKDYLPGASSAPPGTGSRRRNG
jgi:hypothetical protein